jgi:hypothetical protein
MSLPAPAKRRTARSFAVRAAIVVAVGCAVASGPAVAANLLTSDVPGPEQPSTEPVVEGSGEALVGDDRGSVLDEAIADFPVPEGESLAFAEDVIVAQNPSEDALRSMVAFNAACLWWRAALEEGAPTEAEIAGLRAIPTWPEFAAGQADPSFTATLVQLAEDVAAGRPDELRSFFTINCTGLPE